MVGIKDVWVLLKRDYHDIYANARVGMAITLKILKPTIMSK
jgi:hypothetical protein